ncbi:MAG: hypothetical protein LC733_06745 [Actinobacteria bacterium]|nr:hypothetical protein [Actinomycetota bacterium]
MTETAVGTATSTAPPTDLFEPPALSGPIARSLSRVEGRNLLLSPVALVGLALVALPALSWLQVSVHDLRARSMDMVFHAFPMAAGALLAANLATLRSRRHRTDELFNSLPAAPEARTGAHLLSALWPAAVACAFFAIMIGAAASMDSFGRPDGAELLVGPLLVAGAAVLGVMVARWVPTPAAALVTLVAIAAIQVPVSGTSIVDRGWRRLGFWTYPGDLVPELLPPRLARWHVVYLVGLVAMAAVGALLVHGLRRPVVVAGTVAIAVVATAAWFQTRPLSSEGWAARNAFIERPQDHQVCEDRSGIRYCAYPAYTGLIDVWAGRAQAVLRAVPPGQMAGRG